MKTASIAPAKASATPESLSRKSTCGHLPHVGIIVSEAAPSSLKKDFSMLLDGISTLKTPTMVYDGKEWLTDSRVMARTHVFTQLDEAFFNDCDVVIFMPFENVPEKLLKEVLQRGIVPIASDKNALCSNYNPNKESGNSFTFSGTTPWEAFAALVRACETFKFPFDWKHIVKQARRSA